MNIADIKRKAQAAQGYQMQEPTPGTKRDLAKLYRAAYEYHQRNTPAQKSLEYWERAVQDLNEVINRHNQDPLLMGLLKAVFADLEREQRGEIPI